MVYKINKKNKAFLLRKKGYSLSELSKEFKIAKSTASIWTRNIKLNQKATLIINNKNLLGRKKALEVIRIKRELVKKELKKKIENELEQIYFSKSIKKMQAAIFIWTEGGKSAQSYVSLINSDPALIKLFMYLLRTCFKLDESKWRALIHIHEYHDEKKIKLFWSKITHLPLSQFNKCYLKPHTKKRIREGYNGSLRIRYYDSKIASELHMIYNMLPSIQGV